MSRVEPTLSLSLPLRPLLLLLLLLAERAVSTHTECFIEIYDYPALCGYERSAVCVYARAYTRTHTHAHGATGASGAGRASSCVRAHMRSTRTAHISLLLRFYILYARIIYYV